MELTPEEKLFGKAALDRRKTISHIPDNQGVGMAGDQFSVSADSDFFDNARLSPPSQPRERQNIISPEKKDSVAKPQGTPTIPRASLVAPGLPGLISEADFSNNVEPTCVKVKLIKFDKKMIGTSNFVVHIEIQDLPDWVLFAETRITYNEFQAFYKALTLKFKNMQFVKIPATAWNPNAKEITERMHSLMKLFQQIITYAGELQEMRYNMMRFLHRFIFEKAKPLEIEVKQPMNTIVDGQQTEAQVSQQYWTQSLGHEELAAQSQLSGIPNYDQNSDLQNSGDNKKNISGECASQSPPTTNLESIGENENMYERVHGASELDLEFEPLEHETRPADKTIQQQNLINPSDASVVNNQPENKQLYTAGPSPRHSVLGALGQVQTGTPIRPRAGSNQQSAAAQGRISQAEVRRQCERELKTVTENCLGYLYAQIPGETSWNKYFVNFKESQLQFYINAMDNAFKFSYVCNKIQIRLTKKYVIDPRNPDIMRKLDVIILTHEYDKLCLYVTVPLIYESIQQYPEYTSIVLESVKNQMKKFAEISPTDMLEMNKTNRYSWGKIMVNVKRISDFPFMGNIFIRITLAPWQVKTKNLLHQRQAEFNQQFFCPISNFFQTLRIEVVNRKQDGWLSESFKEVELASFDIRIPDIHKEPFEEDGKIRLPLPAKMDWKKIGLTQIVQGTKVGTENVPQPMLHLQVQDLTRVDANIVYNPNRDIIEDRKSTTEYQLKDIQVIMTRTRLVIDMIEYCIHSETFVFNFYYPRFSYLCWALIHMFIYFYRAEYILTYALAGMIFIVCKSSEFWTKNITPINQRIFFAEHLLHPKILSTNNILTTDKMSVMKYMQKLQHSQTQSKKDKEHNFDVTKAMYNVKDVGLSGAYTNFKKGASHTLSWLEVICDFFEKLRNLFVWDEQMQTQRFTFVLIVAFLIVSFLPLRAIVQMAICYKFMKKKAWQRKRIENNSEVCRIEFHNFLQEKKLAHLITEFNENWEVQIKKQISRKALEEKLTTYFQNTVRLFLPREILSLCETPNQLIEYVGMTNSLLKLPNIDRNDIHQRENPFIRKKPLPLHIIMRNFIMNRIPSDLYRMRNPKMRLEKENNNLVVVQRQIPRTLPTNTGGRWGFINKPTQLQSQLGEEDNTFQVINDSSSEDEQ